MRLMPNLRSRARTAPFHGQNLMGPNPEEFDRTVLKLKDGHTLHRGLTDHFEVDKPVSSRRSDVWSRLGPASKSSQDSSKPAKLSFRGKEDSSRERESTCHPDHQRQQNSRSSRGARQWGWGRGSGRGSRGSTHCSWSWSHAGGSASGVFSPFWKSLLGEVRAFQMLQDGVKLKWMDLPPPLTWRPVSFGTRNSRQDLQQAVDSLLLKGAVETVDKPSSLGFLSSSRHAVRHTHRGAPTQDASRSQQHAGSLEVSAFGHSPGPSQTLGDPKLYGNPGAKGQDAPPSHSVVGQRGLVPGGGALVRHGSGHPLSTPSGGLVGVPSCTPGCSTEYTRVGVDTLHRRLMSWMGCTAWWALSPRVLVGGPAPMPYQCAWVGSCPLRSQGLLSIPPTPCGVSDVRQRCGRWVHPEGRQDAIVQVDQACDLPPEILRPDEYHLGPGVPSWISQHPSRCSVACGTDPADRMVDPSAAAGSGVHQVGDTMDRFVCDLREQEATDIRITIPGHEGQIRGRHVSSVDGNGNGARLPTIQDAAGGLEQNTEIPRSVILIAPWRLSASWICQTCSRCLGSPQFHWHRKSFLF